MRGELVCRLSVASEEPMALPDPPGSAPYIAGDALVARIEAEASKQKW